VRSFFVWLAGQPGFRSVLNYGHADYFSLTEKEARVAKASSERPVPSVDDVVRLITTAPADTPVQRRDQSEIIRALGQQDETEDERRVIDAVRAALRKT
jgi:hypothetical protein